MESSYFSGSPEIETDCKYIGTILLIYYVDPKNSGLTSAKV